MTGDALQEPMPEDLTESLSTYPFTDQSSHLTMDVFNFEDSMLEGSILEEDNSDIFDQSMPIPPENAFDVPYVKFNYLYEITKGFHKDMEIGKGGFSEVYKAETARSKKMLAIKKLKDTDEARDLINFEGKCFTQYCLTILNPNFMVCEDISQFHFIALIINIYVKS